MALTATATQGLEFLRYTQPGEVLHVPGDPGDTFTRGDLVVSTAGEGLLDPAASAEIPVARVTQTTVCPANTTAFPKPANYDPADRSGANLCVIPVEPLCPAGTPIYLMTFASHTDDENIAAYTEGTPSMTLNSGALTTNDANGAMVYVYGGVGIGQVNIVASYADTQVATLHRVFDTDLTTASDVIMLGGDTANNAGIGFFSRIDLADQNNLTADAANASGEFTVYLDFRDMGRYLSELKLPVIPSSALYQNA